MTRINIRVNHMVCPLFTTYKRMITQMLPTDVHAVQSLIRSELGDKAEHLSTILRFNTQNPNLAHIYELEGEIAGVILASDCITWGMINHLIVHPKFRLESAGKALLDEVMHEFRAIQSIDTVFVHVKCNDTQARAFFLTQGFRLASRSDGNGIFDILTIDL